MAGNSCSDKVSLLQESPHTPQTWSSWRTGIWTESFLSPCREHLASDNGKERNPASEEAPKSKNAYVIRRFSHVLLFATLWTVAHQVLCPWDSPDKNIEVGCHFLFQGGSSQPSDHTRVSCFLQRQVGSLPLAPPGKAAYSHLQLPISNTSCFIFVCCLSPPVMRQFQ